MTSGRLRRKFARDKSTIFFQSRLITSRTATSLFLSARLLYTAVTILPVIGVFAWFHEFVVLPRDPLTWPLFLVSLVMAGAIQFLIAYALAMLAFWILEISTIVFILYSFEILFERSVVPARRHA